MGCGSSATSMTARRRHVPASWSATRSSTIDGAPYHEIMSFKGKVGRTVEVQASSSRRARSRSSVKVRVELLKPLPMFEQAITDSAKSSNETAARSATSACGRWRRLGSMDAVAEALATGPLKDVDGLVLDLRGRWGGGSSDAAELFLGRHAVVPADPTRRQGHPGQCALAQADRRHHRRRHAQRPRGLCLCPEGKRYPAGRDAHRWRIAGRPRLYAAGRQPARAGGFGCRDRRRCAPGRERRHSRMCRSRSACPTRPGTIHSCDAAIEEMRRILVRG